MKGEMGSARFAALSILSGHFPPYAAASNPSNVVDDCRRNKQHREMIACVDRKRLP